MGRFIQADTVVPGFNNPQALNRYSYSPNNPINRIDPSGHWSFKKFFKAFVSAFVAAVVTAVTLGAGAPLAVALMAGGAVGGFIGGGWTDQGWSWKGALTGAAIGGATGFALGGGLGTLGVIAGWGVVIGGAGYTVATEGTDGLSTLLGGILGGAAGFKVGVGISKATNPNSTFNKSSETAKIDARNQENKTNKNLEVDNKRGPTVENKTADTDFAIAYDENLNFDGVIIKDKYYPANAQEGIYIQDSSGKVIKIPDNWKGTLSRNERGIVYSENGSLNDPNTIRVMGPRYGPNADYPNGYVVETRGNQPLDTYGKPSSRENTHFHLDVTGLK